MYRYEDMKPKLFTEEGQRLFLEIRDRVNSKLGVSGAVRMLEAMENSSGDVWEMLACVDRLVELKEPTELTGKEVADQYRVFVRTWR